MRELKHLLNCLNAVTCKHRHGQPISKRRLDDLSNAQVDYERAADERDAAFERARGAFHDCQDAATWSFEKASLLSAYFNPAKEG